MVFVYAGERLSAERPCAQGYTVYHGNQATAALEGLLFRLNWDETPLWLDMLDATTITRSGKRSVPIRTTGHEKNQFTVCVSAMADGRKLKPYVKERKKTNTRTLEGSWCCRSLVEQRLDERGLNQGLVETLLGHTEFRATTAS